MPELEQGQEEYDNDDDIESQDEYPGYKHEQNDKGTRQFFALLCFLIAFICLSIFIDGSLDFVSRLLVLVGMIVFGLGGILLLERRDTPRNTSTSSSQMEIKPSDDDSAIENTDTEEEQLEDEDANEIELSSFEQLVEEALTSIPEEFQEKMENLVVLVESEPDEEELRRVGTKEGHILLGLYSGVPLTAQGHAGVLLPERITIYQHPIEEYCNGDPERIRSQVRKTVLHEVAHHFGIGHEEMPIWVK